TPDAISITLFGPGVIDVINSNTTSARNTSHVTNFTRAGSAWLPVLSQMMKKGSVLAIHALRSAVQRGNTGTAYLDQAERLHDRDELVDLRALAGNLEDEVFGRGISDLRLERLGETQRLDASFAASSHLHQRQLALQRMVLPHLLGVYCQVVDLVDRHDALQ